MKVLAAGMICLLDGIHAPVLTLRAADGARLVRYSQTQIIPIRAEIRFSTLIILPADEEILDFTTGDKDYWIINGAHNLCYLHPAQAGIRTNLNLVTASGHVYSFLLTEVSKERNADPDLKVFVVPDDGPSVAGMGAAAGAGAQYVRASEVQAYKDELAQLQKQVTQEIQQAHTEAQQEVTQYRSQYGEKLQFDYHYSPKANQAPSTSRPFTTTTNSPTSSRLPKRSPPSTRSRTTNRTSSILTWKMACTSFRKSWTKGTWWWARRSSPSRVGEPRERSADLLRQGFGYGLAISGERILDRFLNILPTVTIREGARVKVYLSNDPLLPDYNSHKMPPNL